MASNITVKIHVEPYIKRYYTNIAKNRENPLIFPKGHWTLNLLLPLLISAREYTHKKIIESYQHNMNEYIEFMLPWSKGIYDIRTRHFISPENEKKYYQILKDGLTGSIVDLCRLKEWRGKFKRKTFNAIFDDFAKKHNLFEFDNYDTIRREYYRRISREIQNF